MGLLLLRCVADATFDRWREECVAALQRAEAFRDLRAVRPLLEAMSFVLGAE